MERETLDNDRAFTVYALTLIGIIATVITTSVASGIATVPTAGVFLEHLALSVGFRAGYKSFGGIDWLYTFADALGLYERRTSLSELGAGVMA
jgi:hypothetical protein